MSTPGKAGHKPLLRKSAAKQHPGQPEQHEGSGSPAPSNAADGHIEEEIDEALKESFPASDPPSFTPTARLGLPNRDHDAGGS